MKNGKLYKSILISVMLIISANIVFAESCIMVSPSEITKIECENENIVEFHILSTLMNEKKSVIVTSKSDGETSFSIRLKNKKCDYKASVNGEKLEIKGDKTIKVLKIDLPPEAITTKEK